MSKIKLKDKKNILIFIFFTAFAFAILYICTASSPSYATNPWNDANAFLTVGKAMANGLTVYKDIFEQKGPLLYLIHALACFISDTSFTGVYVMQSLSLCVTSFAAYKLASLYVGTGWSVASAVLTCFVTVNSSCYYYGDSAEEFCLPFLMISIYYFCRYFKNTEQALPKRSVFFLVGFFAGCVAMIKFTVIGFWFAWAAYISLYTLFAKKDFKKAVINALVFLGGMGAAIAPWIVYFAVKGGLRDFIYTYFILNATAYPMTEKLSFFARLWKPIYIIGTNLAPSPAVLILSGLGMTAFLFTSIFTEKKLFSRLSVPFVCCLGIYIIYFGIRSYSYYLLPLSAFMVFSFIAIFFVAGKLIKGKAEKIVSAVVCAVLIVASVIGGNYLNICSTDLPRKGESTIQSEAVRYIKSHNSDGIILNYGCLDTGIYLAADQLPVFRHFEEQNLLYEKYSENVDEQNRYINEHLADFVVTVTKPEETVEDIYEKNPSLKTDYNIVICKDFSFSNQNIFKSDYTRTFYLFELKGN